MDGWMDGWMVPSFGWMDGSILWMDVCMFVCWQLQASNGNYSFCWQLWDLIGSCGFLLVFSDTYRFSKEIIGFHC